MDDEDVFQKIDAQLMCYAHIPFPEKLDDETYWRKWKQIKWLREYEAKQQPQ
jgi:hypothetical protein